MNFKIYDDRSLKDVLITGSHDYARDEFYLRVEGHNLVSTVFSDTLDNPEIKKELLEHPDHFTLDGKAITEISLHRYQIEKEYQIEVVLYNQLTREEVL